MYLKSVVIFIIGIPILCSTDTADKMVQAHMSFELIFIKEVHFAERTERVHEYHIAEIIYIPSLHMFFQLNSSV
jgi:hypothetical protein